MKQRKEKKRKRKKDQKRKKNKKAREKGADAALAHPLTTASGDPNCTARLPLVVLSSLLELGHTASLDAQSNTICPNACIPLCSTAGFWRELLARLAAGDLIELCKLRFKHGPVHAAMHVIVTDQHCVFVH